MRTLVTGGAGFIGSHLVRALVERGDEVVVLDSLEPQVHGDAQPELPAGVELIVGDVGDRDARRPRARGRRPRRPPRRRGRRRPVDVRDRALHRAQHDGHRALPRARRGPAPDAGRASSSPRRCRSTARASTSARSTAASRPARAPRSSCSRARGRLRCPTCGASSSRSARPRPSRSSRPRSTRSTSATTRRCASSPARPTGSPTVALRFFNVYGPGQALSNPYTGVAAIFASRLLNGRPPIIFEDGEQSRDFIHVSDIVQGILLALESDSAVGPRGQPRHRPPDVGRRGRRRSSRPGMGLDIEPSLNQQYRAGDIRHCFADPTRARELLGFEAQRRFEDGMRELVGWLADQEAEDQVDDATQRAGRPRPGPLGALERSRDRTHEDQADLAIIIVSTNEAKLAGAVPAHRLRARGRRQARRRRRRQRVDRRHARARRVAVPGRARRRLARTAASPTPTTAARMTCTARYVLFLNPDTEIVDGTFGELVAAMDARPDVGMAGRQAAHRRRRAVADHPLLPERPRARWARPWPPSAGRGGRGGPASASSTSPSTRREVECDWTSGSFMFARREALLSAGLLDERFFIYSEEPDLCLRIKRAGWAIRHLPTMTIIHHAGKGGLRPKMIAQDVFTRRQYAAQAPRGARIARPILAAVGARHMPCAPPPPGVGSDRSAGQPPGWPCARSSAARRRRSALRRRRRSAARARASRLPVRRPQPPVRVACVGLTFRGRNDWALRGGRSVVPTRHPASGTT